MENKKKISLTTYIISLIVMGVLVVIIMLALFNKNKNNSNIPTTYENNQAISSNDTDENEVQNIVENKTEESNTNTNTNTNTSESNEQDNTNKKILYSFESADNLAAHGYPRRLNIYKITSDILEFDYNGGYDLKKLTLDLKLSGKAKSISENTYRYTTKIDGNEYEILLEFNKNDNAVKLSERHNSKGEYSYVNLFNISKTSVKNILSSISKKQSKIDWEEYPSDIEKQVKKMMKDRLPIENEKAMKMSYSILKNGYEKKMEEYLYILGDGDGTEIIEVEINYPQFDYWSNDKKIYKYKDNISYKMADFCDYYYYPEIASDDDNLGKEMEKVDKYSLEKKTEYQYNNLKKLKKWHGHREINYKDLYYKVGKLAIMNGNNKNKTTYKNNSRAKKIRVTVNNDKKYTFNLKDTNKVQIFDINYKQNTVKKPVEMKVEVLDTYEGDKSNDIYISDLQFTMESNIPQGR